MLVAPHVHISLFLLTKGDSVGPLDVFRHQDLSIHSIQAGFLNFSLTAPVRPVHKPMGRFTQKLQFLKKRQSLQLKRRDLLFLAGNKRGLMQISIRASLHLHPFYVWLSLEKKWNWEINGGKRVLWNWHGAAPSTSSSIMTLTPGVDPLRWPAARSAQWRSEPSSSCHLPRRRRCSCCPSQSSRCSCGSSRRPGLRGSAASRRASPAEMNRWLCWCKRWWKAEESLVSAIWFMPPKIVTSGRSIKKS